jgi:MarR family transcriptional regulator, organic hydroperoxide resistance regulator
VTAGARGQEPRAPGKSGRAAKSTSLPNDPGTPTAALGSTLDFMRLLWAMDHGLQRRSKRMEVEIGVTGMQRVVIRLIGRFPNVTAGRLAELVHVHPSTLTGVLKRLVDRHFVERERDRTDARIARFVLTPEGGKIDGSQAGTVEAAVRRALARLEPGQVEAARVVLSAVADELARADR